jgi:hypothetical protein
MQAKTWNYIFQCLRTLHFAYELRLLVACYSHNNLWLVFVMEVWAPHFLSWKMNWMNDICVKLKCLSLKGIGLNIHSYNNEYIYLCARLEGISGSECTLCSLTLTLGEVRGQLRVSAALPLANIELKAGWTLQTVWTLLRRNSPEYPSVLRCSLLVPSRNWTTISRMAGWQPRDCIDYAIPAFVGNSVLF